MTDKPKIRTRNVNAKLTAQDLGYKQGYNQKVITVSPKKATYSEWPDESRIDAIGQNGNTGEHYESMV